jgi:hypothetical protein
MNEGEQERTRVTRGEWSKRVERWSDSGLTCKEFAAELGINPRTLTYWKWVLGKEANGAKRALGRQDRPSSAPRRATKAIPAHTGLLEIQVSPSDARIELELRNGRRVRIPTGFDANGLRELLAVLEGQ